MNYPPNWPVPPAPPDGTVPPVPRQSRMGEFEFWCQKVLPLVYDDSLSYYEVLCKVVDYINNLIKQDNATIDRIDELQQELAVVQKWIDDYDTSFAEAVINQYIATMVMFGLTDDGRFCAYIPPSWKTVNFATSGLDISTPLCLQFGHLILCY